MHLILPTNCYSFKANYALLSYRQQCHRRRWGKRRLEQKHSASDLQPPSHRWRWLLAVHQNDPHKHCTPDLQREKQEPYLTECKINKLLIHATNLTTYNKKNFKLSLPYVLRYLCTFCCFLFFIFSFNLNNCVLVNLPCTVILIIHYFKG